MVSTPTLCGKQAERNWSTTIYVEDDKVICRYFQQVDDLSVSVWLETAKMGTLGKHAEGSALVTLDTLYGNCASLALSDSSSRLFYREDDGILKSCYFFTTEETYPDFNKIRISEIDSSACAMNKLWEK